MPWPRAVKLLLPVPEGLYRVHQAGFMHRDLKPGNLYLTKDDELIVLDFGSARQVTRNHTRSLLIFSEGYVPYEQYLQGHLNRQGPWTDVYAIAATLYFMLTGCRLPRRWIANRQSCCNSLIAETGAAFRPGVASGAGRGADAGVGGGAGTAAADRGGFETATGTGAGAGRTDSAAGTGDGADSVAAAAESCAGSAENTAATQAGGCFGATASNHPGPWRGHPSLLKEGIKHDFFPSLDKEGWREAPGWFDPWTWREAPGWYRISICHRSFAPALHPGRPRKSGNDILLNPPPGKTRSTPRWTHHAR